MNQKLIEKFAHIDIKPNAMSMDELIKYVEDNWGAYRVKIPEQEYYSHIKYAQDFMKEMGRDPLSVTDEIKRYHIYGKRVFLIFGSESEYITTEGGIKYYNALTMLKGLTEEDIATKNARWLQYMILLDMSKDWEQKEQELLEELKRQDAERASLMNGDDCIEVFETTESIENGENNE